jgi:hypothetical protein
MLLIREHHQADAESEAYDTPSEVGANWPRPNYP